MDTLMDIRPQKVKIYDAFDLDFNGSSLYISMNTASKSRYQYQ
jgi:hypothetical protein